jgi:hypothetical protein
MTLEGHLASCGYAHDSVASAAAARAWAACLQSRIFGQGEGFMTHEQITNALRFLARGMPNHADVLALADALAEVLSPPVPLTNEETRALLDAMPVAPAKPAKPDTLPLSKSRKR